jgi:hypothetical protein
VREGAGEVRRHHTLAGTAFSARYCKFHFISLL